MEGDLKRTELIEQLENVDLEFNEVRGNRRIYLNGTDVENEIRTNEVARVVSFVARIKEVREKLVSEQRKIATNGGVVMDGRDIGTVVFPKAELKLFVTANTDIRARRRLNELQLKGIQTSFEEVQRNLRERDQLDTSREESPLRQAEDAVILDNSNMSKEQQLKWVLELIQKRFFNKILF